MNIGLNPGPRARTVKPNRTVNIYIYMSQHTLTHTNIHTQHSTRKHACTSAYAHAPACTHVLMQVCVRTHPYMHTTHTHTHTHACMHA